MSDKELVNYIKERNYHITTSEYAYICSQHTSIDHVKYLQNNQFILWTTFGNEIIFYVVP